MLATWFEALTKTQGFPEQLEWAELWARLDAAGKLPHRGDGWSPVEFRGDARSKQNVVRAFAVGLDFDDGRLSFQELVEQLAVFRGYVHTTKSHEAGSPRLRAMVCLDRPVDADEYKFCWSELAHALGGAVDVATSDASRFWFLPSTPHDDSPFLSKVLTGKEASVKALLASAKQRQPHHSQVMYTPSLDTQPATGAAAWANKAMREFSATPKGGRNAALNKAAFTIFGRLDYVAQLGESKLIHELTRTAEQMGLERGEIAKTIASARAAGAAKPITPSSPISSGSPSGQVTATAPWHPAVTADGPRLIASNGEIVKDRRVIVVKSTEEIFAVKERPKFISEGLEIGPGRPMMIHGLGASAKTLACQSIALSVAAGVPIWGKYKCDTQEGVGVIHFDYELGEGATDERYQRLARGHGITIEQLGGRLHTADLPAVYLTDASATEAYVNAIGDCKLAIIDSFRAATPGANENESEIRQYLDLLMRVSNKTGCSFIVIHHSNKPARDDSGSKSSLKSSFRGNTSIYDACNCVLSMRGTEDKHVRSVQQTKQSSNARGGGMHDFRLAVEDVARGDDPLWGLRVMFNNSEPLEDSSRKHSRSTPMVSGSGASYYAKCKSVCDFLTRVAPGSTCTHILNGTGLFDSRQKMHRHLTAMQDQGLLSLSDDTKEYTVTEQGADLAKT